MPEFTAKPIGHIPRTDAVKELRVRIDETDRQAVVCSPTRCVGANALNRRKGYSDCRIGAVEMYATVHGVPMRWDVSPDTKAMIKAYDDDNQVMPAGIVLVFVPPKRKMGSRNGAKSGSSKRSNERTNLNTRNAPHRHIWVEPPNDDS